MGTGDYLFASEWKTIAHRREYNLPNVSFHFDNLRVKIFKLFVYLIIGNTKT